ncbi:MAG: GIN domain-containing protein [Lepagella sp.]
MKKYVTTLFCLVITLIMVSCKPETKVPDSKIVDREYSVKGFNIISCSSPGIEVCYKQSVIRSVRATGPENMVDALKVKVDRKGILNIEIKNCDSFEITKESQVVKVMVSSPSIRKIVAMDRATVIMPEPVNMPNLFDIETFLRSNVRVAKVRAKKISVNSFEGSVVNIEDASSSPVSAAPFTGSRIIIAGQEVNR